MILCRTGSTDPFYNLACEEYLLRYSDQDIFMLWQNDPVVVIGKNQDIYAEVVLEYTEEQKIAVVRRITGGGAVYHDGGNVNYSFITSREKAKVLDFEYFTSPIRQALAEWGVEVSLSGRNDLLAAGAKFSGNAQYASCERILHHGTLLFDSDLAVLSRTLRPAPEKLQSKAIASVRSRVTNLRPLLPPMSVGEFIEGIANFVCRTLQAEKQELMPNETILMLADRNRSEDYIYGRKEKYDRKKRRRFAGGMVTVLLSGERVVEKIRFEGDYFGERDVREAETLLQNCPLTAVDLSNLLSCMPIEKYIHGVTAEELAACILSAEKI